ncbi:MAG: glycosyl hydrolase family protein, partial [Promethearchaeota archaeon CR_4]
MKTFSKADFATSLQVVWAKARPVLEAIAINRSLNYVTGEFINQLADSVENIANSRDQKSDSVVIEEVVTIAKRLASVFSDVLEGKKVYVLDGMHGGILFNNFFPGMAAPNREWAGYKDFPEGYEEFDWPEFAFNKVEDALAVARSSGGKISLQIGMSTFDALAGYYPTFIKTVKDAWAEGYIELVDGAYADTYDLLLGAEANVRNYCLGMVTAEKLFGHRPVILARQEIGWHPQLPQFLKQMGYAGVVLRTRFPNIVPSFPYGMMHWRGLDGVNIPCLPATEGIPTGDYIGGIFYNQVLRDIITAKKTPENFIVLTNLEDLISPIEGRQEFFLTAARGHTAGFLCTYSEFFALAGSPTKEQYISRDQFYVNWECQPGGERWKRAFLYNLIKPTEYALLVLEKMATLNFLIQSKTNSEELDNHQYLWKTFLQATTHNIFS